MKKKKTRIRIPKENKIRAELQKEIGSKCPFCENSDVGHFQIHHIDENPANNQIENLILLCSICHSKITKCDLAQIEVYKKKIELLKAPIISKPKAEKTVNFNSKVGNALIGDYNKITIKHQKSGKQKYPEGCIGFETVKANYVGYLIERYNKYKEYELGKGRVNYAMFSAHLKKRYKIGTTRTIYNVPIEKFEELVVYIHQRIDSTKLARINKSKGRTKNYISFEEYKLENE